MLPYRNLNINHYKSIFCGPQVFFSVKKATLVNKLHIFLTIFGFIQKEKFIRFLSQLQSSFRFPQILNPCINKKDYCNENKKPKQYNKHIKHEIGRASCSETEYK